MDTPLTRQPSPPRQPSPARQPSPPVAEQRFFVIESRHGSRLDEYYWLRDDSRSDPEVLGYLEAENAWREHALAHLAPLEERLYQEFLSRIRQEDASVPYRKRGHFYYSRFDAGDEYPVHARRQAVLDAPEQVLVDQRERALGHAYYDLGGFDVSRNERVLAWTEDTIGRREYTLRFRDLVTGEILDDTIAGVEPQVVWAGDNSSVLYIEKDPCTLLGRRVRRHVLGTPVETDTLVHEEHDESYYTWIDASKDERFLFIGSTSTLTTELRFARADDPSLGFEVLLPRAPDHEYEAEPFGDRWIMRTNLGAANFRLVEADFATVRDPDTWRELIAHREDASIAGFDVFETFLAVEERSGGLRRVRLRDWTGSEDRYIDAAEPAFQMALGPNEETDSRVVRYVYTSLTTPVSTYDYDLDTGRATLLKREPVLGDFDPANYVTEYLRAPARDGESIPVALVYRRGCARDGTAPLLQTGYGAYGLSSDPGFSSRRLSLLDRGFVYAIAQVRGGQELGRRWYDQGRLLAKRNSFDDFVDVTRFLVSERYVDGSRVVATGGSAGGLLVGAMANMAPQDYRAIVAHVPFVDVVTTMLDPSIPLTTNEYEEWGDPRERRFYEYMLSYSPYDNVRPQAYPALLVTSGLWDSQVQYFEPAKWVARLRRLKTDDRPLYLRIEMEAGHGGRTGRFRQLRESAEDYAFILDQVGLGTVPDGDRPLVPWAGTRAASRVE
jgi:oligopeptidase B